MFRKTSMYVMVFTAVLLLSPTYIVISSAASARSDLVFAPYSSPEDAYAALKADEVDILCMDLGPDQKMDVEVDTSLLISGYPKLDYFEYALNNNYSIPSYPNAQSPTNRLEVRQAIAHLVNKTYIIRNILQGGGVRIDQPMPASQRSCCNESVVGSNYPYPYDPSTAAQLLATLGFNDTDGNGWLNYPVDWPGIYGEDTTSYPLEVLVNVNVVGGSQIGSYLVSQLQATLASAQWPEGYVGGGFKSNKVEPDPFIFPFILDSRDYHVYTSGFSTGRFPTPMYFCYHSQFWCEGGLNYVTNCEHPVLDQYLEELYFAHSLEEAKVTCKKACGYMADNCVSVPVWTSLAFQAWRKQVPGVICMDGTGINNKYTYINAYRADENAPVRIAISTPNALNVVYSSWLQDWEILNSIYPRLLKVNPYDLTSDQPWVAQDWQVGTWRESQGVEPKTNATYWIRKDVGIVAPVSGLFMRNYTAHDVEFTIWYHYAFSDAWNWPVVMDVHHTRIVDDHTIEVYFDKYDYSLLYDIGTEMPLLPKNEVISQLCYVSNVSFSLPAVSASTEYQFTDQQVVQMVGLSLEESLMVEGVDYEIVVNSTENCHNVIHFLKPQPAGTYYAAYYTPKWKPTGYYLGSDHGLTWQDTMYSLGSHYPYTSPFDLKKNLYFFLDPPLGETDWRWYWGEAPKPRSGYFQINIFDVVKATASYCHRGDGPYDPQYFPGADLDASDLGYVGIYDIVTITGKYRMKWGKPPP